MICQNCGKEFVPSKNDIRIKFCSEKCRLEYRKKTHYMENYYKENKEEKWVAKRPMRAAKKNQSVRIKYWENEEFRESVKKRSREYNQRHPEKKLAQHLSEFGLTIDDYNAMLKKQNYRCAICGSEGKTDRRFRKLGVDHNHETGAVRGLLCDNCNILLGHAKDNVDILRNAIKYLEEFSN